PSSIVDGARPAADGLTKLGSALSKCCSLTFSFDKEFAMMSALRLKLNPFREHPNGLSTLFFTEMWERFSFYGMKTILVLFMVADKSVGGMGLPLDKAALIFGLYGSAVYLMAMPGGFIGDRLLGAWNAVFLGGIVIAVGHFVMLFNGSASFYSALVLIVLGTGLLKPNITRLVGGLYGKNDQRSESGFALYYMGINYGATLAPIVCGGLAQTQVVRDLLTGMGLDPNLCWHLGFASAGLGMLVGVIWFYLHRQRFQHLSLHEEEKNLGADGDELKRIFVIAILFFFSAMFWSVYEQGGASLNVFALAHVRSEFFGWSFPSTWFQSFQAVFVLILTPVFARIWLQLARANREPSSLIKFSLGLLFLGLGIGVAALGVTFAAAGKISPFWLVFAFFLEVAGEMMFSPVGLRTVDQLAPRRFAGLTLGIWFLSVSAGNFLAGYFSSLYSQENMMHNALLYGKMALALLAASALLALISPRLRKFMGAVR
ncbi:MAG: peptide MFS transporter, partial [Candidatus Obscuribacterales bacterium]|nr:peptide MFS transporter [Candidatus Obscuribacterales bacterium]